MSAALNKGEARKSMARTVFFYRLGEICDRSYDNQRYQASGLNLVVAAITLWNTVYLERMITALLQHEDIAESLLPHVASLNVRKNPLLEGTPSRTQMSARAKRLGMRLSFRATAPCPSGETGVFELRFNDGAVECLMLASLQRIRKRGGGRRRIRRPDLSQPPPRDPRQTRLF